MELLLKVFALCVITAAVASLLRRNEGELALLLALCAAACAAVLLIAAGEPLAIVTPVVVRIKDAAGGICFITSFSTGRSSHRLHSTTRPG